VNEGIHAGIDLVTDGVPSMTSRRLRLYVITLLMLPLLFLVSAIPIVRSDAFPMQSGDPFLMYSDHPFGLKHADCEVVIFGDSTAVTGIDPTLVERITGLKSCSIAESQSIFEILGPYALDTYLRNNVPPKYIIMQFSPEVLSRDSEIFWPEGLTLLLRKKSLLEALPTMARHPVQFYNFAMWAIKTKVRAMHEPPPDFAAMTSIFQARRGLIVLPKPPETKCVMQRSLALPDDSWVRRLRDTYSSTGTRVLVNVAPVPDCTQNLRGVSAGYDNITDNTLPIFPVNLFCDLDRHLTLSGAERSSAQIAVQVLGLAGR
jgi:hypothetical protein